MISRLVRLFFVPAKRNTYSKIRSTARLAVEQMEQRVVPANLIVDPTHYTTIQSAIDAASAGDTIKVASGTYIEQLHFDGAAKSNITLKPINGAANVNVQAPAVLDATHQNAIIDITGSSNVTIQGIRIAGNAASVYGIRVDSNGSATISGNTITGVQGGGESNASIIIGHNQSGDQTVGTATIVNNTITNYFKGGILVDNFGSYALVSGNTVTGSGLAATTAQDGIQISRGADADVRFNNVTQNKYFVGSTESAGILIYNADPDVEVDHNLVNSNRDGIFLFQTTGAEIDLNVTANNTADGIVVLDSWSIVIRLNAAYGNGRNGIALYGGDPYTANFGTYSVNIPVGGSNAVTLNAAYNNGQNGILLDYSRTTNPDGVQANNAINFNSATNNGQNGFLLIAANHNFFSHNAAFNNDASGFSLTASSNDNALVWNLANFNGGYGFSFTGNSDGNYVAHNVATRNDTGGFFQDATSDNTFAANVANRNGPNGNTNFSSNIVQQPFSNDDLDGWWMG